MIIGYPIYNLHLIVHSTDTDDFNTTILNITFGADENAPVSISDISVLIPIVDDDKDEADIQFFIAFLEVVDAVNMDLIDIGRTFSRGIIVDNDGKYRVSDKQVSNSSILPYSYSNWLCSGHLSIL